MKQGLTKHNKRNTQHSKSSLEMKPDGSQVPFSCSTSMTS